MELLNLDSLIGETRPVMLNGVRYEIKEQTIQQMIESIRAQKTLNRDDAEAMFEGMVGSAKAILPDAPEAEIRNLNINQLHALVEFATASKEQLEKMVDDIESVADEVDEGK